MNILIENVTVVPMISREKPFFRGFIGIEGSKIVLVTENQSEASQLRKQFSDDLKIIDGSEKIAMPGFINTHNHAPMTLMRGYADDLPLMEWLHDHIWPMEAKLTRETIQLGAKLAIAEMLLGGTTTFVDMYWHEEAIGDIAAESGIRAVLAPTMIDFKSADFESDLEAVARKFGKDKHPRITYQIAAHSPYSVSAENLRKVGELAQKHGVGVNIHLAESLDEVVQICEKYGKTPTEFVNDLGLLREGTLANHCVQMTDSDVEIFAQSGASVAHCPQSNMKLGNSTARLKKMRQAGINISLGTDGACSNNDLDMIEEMRTMSFLQKTVEGDPLVIPAYEALEIATVNGAKAIGKEGELGRLVEGYTADIVLLDSRKPHLRPQKEVIANIVYSAKAADVSMVIIDGNIVVEDGHLLTLDIEKILKEVDKLRF